MEELPTTPGYTLPCGHETTMHKICLLRWYLSGSGNYNTCPSCRAPLNIRVTYPLLARMAHSIIVTVVGGIIFIYILNSRSDQYATKTQGHNVLFSLAYTATHLAALVLRIQQDLTRESALLGLVFLLDEITYKFVSHPAVDASTIGLKDAIFRGLVDKIVIHCCLAPTSVKLSRYLIDSIYVFGLKHGYIRIESEASNA